LLATPAMPRPPEGLPNPADTPAGGWRGVVRSCWIKLVAALRGGPCP